MVGDETIAARFYRVRLDRGDGVRKPEPLREMAAAMTAAAAARGMERTVHASRLSEIENGAEPSLKEVELAAAVDPKARGRAWLAFGVRAAAAPPPLDLSKLPGVQPMVGPPPGAETPEALIARLQRERGAASGKRRRKANGG